MSLRKRHFGINDMEACVWTKIINYAERIVCER